MTNQNKKIDDMTWIEKINLMRLLSEYPAVTIMVFIRERVGYCVIKPTWFFLLTAIMLISPLLIPPLAKPFGFMIALYALTMLGLALYWRWQRWKDICKAVRWHTRSPGLSYLERLPLPDWWRSHYRIHRFLDPVAALLAGVIIFFLCHALGLWIMLSAFFLHVHEEDCYKRAINRDLDILDGIIEGEEQTETAKFFEQGQSPEAASRPLDKSAGVPTGFAPDIAVVVIRAKARQRKAAPDNMARETPKDWPDEQSGPIIDQ